MSAKSQLPLLAADGVPGKLAGEDKQKIAEIYNMFRNNDVGSTSSPQCSRLRVVDSLTNRFKFVITNPRNATLSLLRAARLKLGRPRELVLDLQGDKIVVDCWRAKKQENKGTKRRRQPPPLESLPRSVRLPIQEATSGEAEGDRTFLEGILLWILNHDDFCEFQCDVAKEEGYETGTLYKLTLGEFEPVSDKFVRDLEQDWGAFLKDAIFEFSSQSVVLYVAK